MPKREAKHIEREKSLKGDFQKSKTFKRGGIHGKKS